MAGGSATVKVRCTVAALPAPSTARTVNVWTPGLSPLTAWLSAPPHEPSAPPSTPQLSVTPFASLLEKLNDAEPPWTTAPSAGPPVIASAGSVWSSSKLRVCVAVFPTLSVTANSTV